MEAVNLFLLTRNKDMSICSEYENVVSERKEKLGVKKHEYKSLCCLVDTLIYNKVKIYEMDGFHFSYSIRQISKEFDLLKVKRGKKVINIELKAEMIDVNRIQKQLLRNQYYLSHITKNIVSFTYVEDQNKFFTLVEGELIECNVARLITELSDFDDYDNDIDSLFRAKDYLISPLNNPQKFIDRQYFLTDAQERIKNDILDNIQETNRRRFWGITGSAGTGKTLLLYDIARNLAAIGKVCVIHSGILCDGHLKLEREINNLNINDAKSIGKIYLDNYDFILVDETQRIYYNSLESLVNTIIDNDLVGVFSYDPFQTLSQTEENSNIAEKLIGLEDFKELRLKSKIRTNEEMTAFIKTMLHLKDVPKKMYKYNGIDIVYADSIEEANKIIRYYLKKDYTFIEYTKSLYKKSTIDKYNGDINTHEVIGQEFDNVLIIMDHNFKYSEDGHLKASEHPNSNYLFYKLFFQGVSRARENLCIVVVRNRQLLINLINIKYSSIQ